VLDLARELDALGVDARFYSYVSRKRMKHFGLPAHCHVALLPFLFPLIAIEGLFPRFLPRTIERLMCWALDTLVIFRMRRCAVFICMSGMYRSQGIPRRFRSRARQRWRAHCRGGRADIPPWETLGRVPVGGDRLIACGARRCPARRHQTGRPRKFLEKTDLYGVRTSGLRAHSQSAKEPAIAREYPVITGCESSP
jgi:hypothetical protein